MGPRPATQELEVRVLDSLRFRLALWECDSMTRVACRKRCRGDCEVQHLVRVKEESQQTKEAGEEERDVEENEPWEMTEIHGGSVQMQK